MAVDSVDGSGASPAPAPAPAVGIAFPAGNDDFRSARDRCAQACRRFNNTPEDATPELRSNLFLDIVRPARDRRNDGAAVTHDMTFRNPALKARTPFVKPPFYVDYGLRVRIGGSTFINRGCMIMDTPVADVTIGERCNIGPNCCIISVGHPLSVEERSSAYSSIGKPVTIGDHVWIGANVTILGGVTIGDGAVIGAGSVLTKSIPPGCLALGVPARVVQSLTSEGGRPSERMSNAVSTLTEAMAFRSRNKEYLADRKEELELVRLCGNPALMRGAGSHGHYQLPPSPSSMISTDADSMIQAHQFHQALLQHFEQQDQDEGLHARKQLMQARPSDSVPGSETEGESQQRHRPHRRQQTFLRRLFRSEIVAAVAITLGTTLLLVNLFFAGMLVGARRVAVVVDPPSGLQMGRLDFTG